MNLWLDIMKFSLFIRPGKRGETDAVLFEINTGEATPTVCSLIGSSPTVEEEGVPGPVQWS